MFAQQPSVQAYGQGQPQQQQPPPPAQMQQQSQQQQHFHQQLLKSQQQALMQQALMQQQAALYNPALLAAMSSQIEPIPSGNLPPGFDATSCRSVYVGNINSKVTEALLAEVFGSIGPLEGCKLIRKEKSSFGFVDYYDHQFAARAIVSLNGRQIFGQSIKVNWAYASGQREDTTGHFHVFVGDLSPEVTDATLFAAFSLYRSCSDARVMWDQRSGRSRGFGFVSFKNQKDAESAITEMTGKWLGSRAIRCNWATKTNADNQNGDPRPRTTDQVSTGNGPPRKIEAVSSPVTVANDFQQVLEASQKDAPEGNPQYTTVYVGNLAHEVTQTELHRQFYALKVGQIEDVRVQREKGFGFVRYSTHEEAAAAIQSANGKVICGKSVKCSWGNKPTPAGVASTILPPPVPVLPFQSLVGASLNQGYTTADLLAYQRQLALSQAGAGALLPLANQQNLGLGLAAGVNATANRSAMDGGGLGQQRFF